MELVAEAELYNLMTAAVKLMGLMTAAIKLMGLLTSFCKTWVSLQALSRPRSASDMMPLSLNKFQNNLIFKRNG